MEAIDREQESDQAPRSNGAGSSIPVNHILAAGKDVELKKLLRAKATATGRVERAKKEEAEAEQAIQEYVAKTYPTAVPA